MTFRKFYTDLDIEGNINILSGKTYQINNTPIISNTITNGVLISAPSENAVYNGLLVKQNLNTGYISGLILSINSDNTKYNISSGYYVVTDNTNPLNPTSILKTFTGISGVTPTYLATANITYIALDVNGNIVTSASPFTDAQRRSLVSVGGVIHSNRIYINVVNEIKAPIVGDVNQLHDLMKAIGSLNLNGNVYSAFGNNLQINKSAGTVFGLGINASDSNDPHKLTISGQTQVIFRYRLRDGIEYPDSSLIDPTQYDLNGILTPVNNNKFTIQHINLFQSGLSRLQYGQNEYSSIDDAISNLSTENFVIEQNIAENAIFRCYLIIKQNVSNLTAAIAANDARFIGVNKFGGIISGSGSAITQANIISALGYTPENIANKITSISSGSTNTQYPSAKLLYDQLNLKLSQSVIEDTKAITGFIDGNNINVSYNPTGRTITLTGNLAYMWRGQIKTLGSPWTSSAHTATTGSWFLMSKDGINFVWSTTSWNFEDLMIAFVNYDSNPNLCYAIRETHGTMDYKSHEEFHTQIGTYRTSGGIVTSGSYTENTATDAGNSMGFDAATIKDEDSLSTVPAWVDGTYTTMYISGATNVFNVASTLPFTATSNTFIQINNPTTGTMTAGANGNYYNVYQIIMPCASDINSQRFRMIMLQPQAAYSTLALAQAEDVRSLNLGSLASISTEFVVYARITYVTSNADNNIGKCRIATGGISYNIGTRAGQVSVAGFTGNNHAILSNLIWLNSGHLGTSGAITRLASFSAIGTATETEYTSSNTINSVVYRDGSGNFSANTITASLTGNASTASILQTSRTIALSGDVVGNATTFNGSADITIPVTLPNVANAGTYNTVVVNTKGQVTSGNTYSYSLSTHNHYQLYQPNGSNPFVYTDNSGTLHIDGNIVQSGSSYNTHAEQVYTTKDYIILRDGAVAGLSNGAYAGFTAKLYDGVNDGQLVFDNTGTARVGDVGSEQPLATRTETPSDGYIAYWENGNSRLNFKQLTISDITNLNSWTGSTSLTTLGTITSGTWHGALLESQYGGTGINNGGRTLTISTNSGTLLFSGAGSTLTIGAGASVSGSNTGDQSSVSGNAGSSTYSSNSTITNDNTTNAVMYPVWVTANSGNIPLKVSSTKLSFNPSTGALTSSSFIKSGGTSAQFLKADGSVDSTSYTTNTGTVTSVGTGTGLSGGNITTSGTINLSLNSLSEKTGNLIGTDRLVGVSSTTHFSETISTIPLSIFNNDSGWTNNTGTVTNISAGNGMTFTTITGTGSITMGTPSTITDVSTNSVAVNTHNHAITTYSITGTSPIGANGGKVLGSALTISLNSGYGDTQNPYASKTANYFLSAPNGSAGVPTFRSIVAADIPTLNQSTTGNAATSTQVIATVTGTNSLEIVRGNMADNDQFRILIGGTATNAGYVEIATADDATEPIYVRQYTGTFTSLIRTATLLDSSGNTSFPNSLTANSLIKSGGTSAQFLKADGSVDSTSYTTNTGTVTSLSITAGNGLTGGGSVTTSGTITLDVASHAGSAGSIGTINIGADSIGVNLGTTSTTACAGNDGRLSDARTPLSHTHGNITNGGLIGVTANIPLITGTGGIVQGGSFGSTANTFCQGNDGRLSDARTPINDSNLVHRDGTETITGAKTFSTVISSNISSGTDRFFYSATGTVNSFSLYENSGTIYINSYSNMVIRSNQNGGTGGYIKLDGSNVGIKLGASSPSESLSVVGNIAFGNTEGKAKMIYNSTETSIDFIIN